MSKYSYGNLVADAVYSEPLQTLQKGNPLIEALPENQSGKEWYRNLVTTIPYNEDERKYPSYERIECVGALYNCFQPWSTHLKIAEQLSRAIKSGYIARNPVDPRRVKERQQLYECVREKDAEFTRYNLSNATASGFSIIGYSGMGKTSAINHVLSLYPQLISHSQYKGEAFPHSQIVWMKLECPFDGSVKGLCSSFFTEFDRITGDNTYQKHAAPTRVTTDQMMPQIAILAHRHSLGALVIDEIQNISAAKSGGIQKMLNFIVHLVNTIGVPVILLGTPEAIEVLSTNFMTARRNSGLNGAVIMNNLKKNSEDWKIFLRGIWKYQWLNEKTSLTPELMDTLNEESFGIVDVAVKLFASAQIKAIQRSNYSQTAKKETITPELIRGIAKSDDFKLLKKRLSMLQKPTKSSLADSDLALIKWDVLKRENDLREVLPSRPTTSQVFVERNEALQQSISIPKQKTASEKTIIDTLAASDLDGTTAEKLKAAGMMVSPDDEY